VPTRTARGKTFEVKFNKAPRSRTRARIRKWQASHKPEAIKNPSVRIRAVRPSVAAFAGLRELASSGEGKPTRRRAKIRAATWDQKQLLGTLYSALTTYEYVKMESEYKARKAAGRGNVDAEWANVQKGAQRAFAAAGVQASPVDLQRFSKAFNANKANRDAIVKVANTGVGAGGPGRLRGGFTPLGTLVPTVTTIIDRLGTLVTPIPDLCSRPVAEGSFTKHFGDRVELKVNITYWCPTWTDWWRTCTETVIIASASWSVDINVGYKVTCCGATVWGQGSVSVCASFLFLSACASCTATITGVAGVSRTPTATNCSYGLGITASLRCTLFGATIFSASAPFGWTITAPCPPANWCP